MLEKSFKKLKRENPFWSDIICFNTALTNRGYSRTIINKVFRLVNKDDYARVDKIAILEHSYKLSRM